MQIQAVEGGQSGQVDIARVCVHANFHKGALIRQFLRSGSTSAYAKYLGKLTIVSIHDARECEVDMSTCPPLSTSDRRTGNSEGISQ